MANVKELEEEVRNRLNALKDVHAEVASQDFHMKTLQTHLKNLQQELNEALKLKNFREREIESEANLQTLLMSECSAIQREISRLMSELSRIKLCQAPREKEQMRLENELAKITEEIRWDKERLQLWLEEAINKEDDLKTLEQFHFQDVIKFRELHVQIKDVKNEIDKRKQCLDDIASKLRNSKIWLSKTTEEFQAAQQDRQKLISQWERVITQMQQRDKEIEACVLEIFKLKRHKSTLEILLKEDEYILENEKNQCMELEHYTKMKEDSISKLKEETRASDKTTKIMAEIETLKRNCHNTNIDIQKAQSCIKFADDSIKKNEKRIQINLQIIEDLSKQINACQTSTFSAEEKLNQLKELEQMGKLQVQSLQKEVDTLHKLCTTKTHDLEAASAKEKVTQSDIERLQDLEKKCDLQYNRLLAENKKQDRLIRIKEKEIEHLKLEIVKIEQSDNSVPSQDERLHHLQSLLDDRQSALNVLSQEVKQQESEIRKTEKESEKALVIRSDLSGKLDNLKLYNDNSEKLLKDLIIQKQKLMVDENLLKLEVKQLDDLVHNASKGTLEIKLQKQLLQKDLDKKFQEVASFKIKMQAEMRILDEECHQLRLQQSEQAAKSNQLKSRYDILLSPLKSQEKEDVTEVDCFAKVAEEKNVLNAHVDELKSKIVKAEKELVEFEVAIQKLVEHNANLRRSLKYGMHAESTVVMDEQDEDLLLKQLKFLMEEKKSLCHTIETLEKEWKQEEAELQRLFCDYKSSETSLEQAHLELQELENENRALTLKNSRADHLNSKLLNRNRNKNSQLTSSDIQRNIDLRILMEGSKKALQQLALLAKQDPVKTMHIKNLLEEARLPFLTNSPPSSERSSLVSFKSMCSVYTLSSLESGSLSLKARKTNGPNTNSALSVVNLSLENLSSTKGLCLK